MAEPAKRALAELREVQERAAARTARIDQLQAAVASSRSRSRRFLRTLLIVGYASFFAAAMLRIELPAQGALNAALAAAAGGLVLFALLSRAAIHRFVEGRSFLGGFVGSAVARWIARSPAWGLSATRLGSRIGPAWWHYLMTSALAASLIALAWWVGEVVPAMLALALAVGLLRLTWSRRLSTPAEIQYGAMLVAILAMVSTAFWTGDYLLSPTRSALFAPKRAAPMSIGSARDLSSPVTFAAACPRSAPWADSPTPPVLRLREAWLAAGAGAAGCPGQIRETSRGSGVMVSEGLASGAMRGLGIADRDRATVLTGAPARMTASLLMSRGLTGVPTHLTVGDNDLYLVDTRQGTYVLARRGRGGGAVRTDYMKMPPALVGLWVDAMSRDGGWLWPVSSKHRLAGETYFFAGTDLEIVARARCDATSGSCSLSYRDSTNRQIGSRWISPEQLLRYAPSF
jgi:hypothetical protein